MIHILGIYQNCNFLNICWLCRHYFLSSSFLIKLTYLLGSSFFRKSNNLFLFETIFKIPLREELSFLCFSRCLANRLISSLNKAIWTSADPVSFSCTACFFISFVFSVPVKAILIRKHIITSPFWQI